MIPAPITAADTQGDRYCYGCDMPREVSRCFCPACEEVTDSYRMAPVPFEYLDGSRVMIPYPDAVSGGLIATGSRVSA